LSSEDEVVDATIVESAKTDDRKSVMFGWCMTEYHEGCILEFTGHRCSCECHEGGAKDLGQAPAVLLD
jgi:hypothetical protein